MKKVALVFVAAVLVPSLVLAWLAVRSLRDQQFVLERQQSLLDQRVTDALAQNISAYLAQRQQEFAAQVESMAGEGDAQVIGSKFDDQIRQRWPLAEVGFCVTASGKILSPTPNARSEAQMFRLDNSGFLGNREPVEVYWNANGSAGNGGNISVNNSMNFNRAQIGPSSFELNNSAANLTAQTPPQQSRQQLKTAEPAASPNTVSLTGQNGALAVNNFSSPVGGRGGGGGGGGFGGGGGDTDRSNRSQPTQSAPVLENPAADLTAQVRPTTSQQLELSTANELSSSANAAAPPAQQTPTFDETLASKDATGQQLAQFQNAVNYKTAQSRKVSPQSQAYQIISKTEGAPDENLSKVVPAEAEFSQLIGNETDGMLARFLQNKLKLMFWHRLNREPDLIFGAQLNLNRVVDGVRDLVQPDREFQNEICLALLDDNAKPMVVSRPNFQANWKRPFVATEIGDALPHWEVAAYLVNPAQLTQSAHTAKLTLGLLIALLVLAISIGSWLIVRSLNFELKLARQKTDFVSNVSHELKTPLTSIRMFSELLAEGRVSDATKQHSYLNIISTEASRLTRLINNVLDFSRMESGEKKYNFQPCDLVEIIRATTETFRPHLEANGFKLDCEWPSEPISVRGDADGLSQVIVNLLSNAEKYANGRKEIIVELAVKSAPLPHAEIKVLDRGSGVPSGSEEKIFEKFYRAHNSLSSGIQGSGLGLTIARQISRAHGGDVVYEPHEGGGSCFIMRLPISTTVK